MTEGNGTPRTRKDSLVGQGEVLETKKKWFGVGIVARKTDKSPLGDGSMRFYLSKAPIKGPKI